MNYPITRTQMTMPGTSGGIKPHLSFDTGEAEMWRAVGQIAQAGLGTAQKIYLLQAEQQFMDATLKAEEEITRMAKSFETNLDETTYHKEFQKSVGTVRKYTPKNPLAAKDYNNWVKKQTLQWQEGVDEAFRIRVINKWKATELELVEKYKQTGNGAQLFIHENTGVALGYQSRDAALKVIMDTTRASQRIAAEYIALGPSPETFLEKYKTYQDLKADFPALYPGDFQDLRSSALGQQRHLGNKQQDEQNIIKNKIIDMMQAHDIGTKDFINENIIDADERYTWLQRYSREMERQADGKDIITDQRVKHEILDYADAINWPDTNITANQVLEMANEARYPSKGDPTIDDSAYDEIRDMLRRNKEDKSPFSQSYVEKGIGELITGAPSSVLGIPLPTLRTRDDYIKHATNLFGRYVNKIPGVMETINAKFPPQIPPKRKEETIDNPAHDFDGEIIGSYNPDGSITLNRLGVKRLYELAGMDVKVARQMIIENRYVIPQVK